MLDAVVLAVLCANTSKPAPPPPNPPTAQYVVAHPAHYTLREVIKAVHTLQRERDQ